jgi:hypothetical protein
MRSLAKGGNQIEKDEMDGVCSRHREGDIYTCRKNKTGNAPINVTLGRVRSTVAVDKQ